MKITFTQEQIIWIQEWLSRLEADFDTAKKELGKELYQMKKDAAEVEEAPPKNLMGLEC